VSPAEQQQQTPGSKQRTHPAWRWQVHALAQGIAFTGQQRPDARHHAAALRLLLHSVPRRDSEQRRHTAQKLPAAGVTACWRR
jgi:hypothetical protein